MKKCPLSLPLVLAALWLAATTAAHGSGSCAADIDGDGDVDYSDQLQILNLWGTADPRADLNGNHYVGDADLQTLYDNLGPCPSCPADLNGSGRVNADDRRILEAAYGRGCTGDLGRNGEVGSYDQEILLTSWTGSADPDADPRADLDGDGDVDFGDLSFLAGQWGNDCRPDLTKDGFVNTDDLWLLLGSWGACP